MTDRTIDLSQYEVAILLPCYNEAAAIVQTIQSFRKELPHAKIYVYDNNSTDNTKAVAEAAGAIVRSELNKGKGNVVRRMFADVEADVYVLADGDSTYDAAKAPEMIQRLLENHLDSVVGIRVPDASTGMVYRRGHTAGNKVFSTAVALLFGRSFTDIFSGYRIFSRRFVKSFPARSTGFEIESEMTIHCLEQRLPCAELATTYIARPEGSTSKLNSYRDGCRILWRILLLLKIVRPLLFFSAVGSVLALISIILFIPIYVEYLHIHLIPRIPTIVFCTGLMLVAILSFSCGIVLDHVAQARKEFKRLLYLSLPYLKQK